MSDPTLLCISGSLRQGACNRRLLGEAARLFGAAEVTLADIRFPLFDEDLQEADGIPEAVQKLADQIAAADAVLISTPEYNKNLSGVLKNALDWASRPAYASVFRDKPTGVMSAATGFVGGARGQQHLKIVLSGMATPVFPWPELLVGHAAERIADGRVVHGPTRDHLQRYLDGFVAWVARTRLG